MTLIPHEDLARAHAHYLAQHAPQTRPKTKTEILLEVVREFPDATVAELAEAAERSPSWVRKHLRAAGIVLKSVRRKEVQP
jgi:transposase